MNIAIRADASIKMGSGHIMRCLTLANELINQGHQAFFICRDLTGNLISFLRQQHITVFVIESDMYEEKDSTLKHSYLLEGNQLTDAEKTIKAIEEYKDNIDWVIVDHYGLDEIWEKVIRDKVPYLFALDDLADRRHFCDILLEQNYSEKDREQRYKMLVPASCKILLGPSFALLRDEFLAARDESNIYETKNRGFLNLLVFFGGSDPTNETIKIIEYLKRMGCNYIINIVVGSQNPMKTVIKEMCDQHSNMSYHEQIDYIAELMKRSDLAICSGGSVTWERYLLNLPALLIAVAHNQEVPCKSIADLGLDTYLGAYDQVSFRLFEKAFYTKVKEVKDGKTSQQAIVDGLGKQRIVHEMLNLMGIL